MTDLKTINDSDTELKISVVISTEEYNKQFDSELSLIAKTVSIDGFRPGKIPLNVIKKKYDAQCHQKSISNLIDYHTQKINLEKKLDLIDSPSVKLLDTPSKDKNLSFEVTFNKSPNIDVNEINKIKIEIPQVSINDTDINKVIDNIRKQNTVWNDSSSTAKEGDKVVVDYEGKIEGKDFKNNKQDDFAFVINDVIKGDPATVTLFKEFSDQCLNKNINDNVSVTNNMPIDFPDKELAGKLVKYNIQIKKILTGTLPDLNKDFFMLLGIDTDDEQEFRENVKKHMEYELKDKLTSKKYGLINEKLVDHFSFTPPEQLVIKHQNELETQYAALKKSDNDLQSKIREIALKRVKLNIIYIKLAKEVNSNISDQEAIDFCNNQSPSFRQFYIDKLKKDKASTLLDVKNKMVENSIVDYVINTADITTVDKNFSEVMDG
tara:strand:- start:2658 stop:3962 length:1305 start_codon:yes stop_codon:yes gene_type:complete